MSLFIIIVFYFYLINGYLVKDDGDYLESRIIFQICSQKQFYKYGVKGDEIIGVCVW